MSQIHTDTDTINSLVILIDESSNNAEPALQTAIRELSCSPQDQITIITIVESATSQSESLCRITTLLQSMRTDLHPETRFNVFSVPEGTCQFENIVFKLVSKAKPQAIVLGLCPFFSAAVYSYLERTSSSILVKQLNSFQSIETDEDADWCIRDSPRCSSPIGWD
ncbi:hypothetical protein HDU98_007094 [Podochytrium sp. JEL0797]|nr:hypothetical protein HDU98_007094 [Podochytrium sp. JEL0797]